MNIPVFSKKYWDLIYLQAHQQMLKLLAGLRPFSIFILFSSLLLPASSFASYSLSTNSTDAGSSSFIDSNGNPVPILRLSASSEGSLLTLTMSKIDGDTFTNGGTIYFKAGSGEDFGANRETMSISSGESTKAYVHNLNDYAYKPSIEGYPKDFYVRYEGNGQWIWAGPVSIDLVSDPISKPSLISPADGVDMDAGNELFDWSDADRSNTYRIVLAKDSALNGFNESDNSCTSDCQTHKISCSADSACSSSQSRYDGFSLEAGASYCYSVRAGVLEDSTIPLEEASDWASACFNTNSVAVNANLTVTKDGTGSGVIASLPSGIDCGNTCQASYAEDAQITLTATPDADSEFTGWNGASCGGENTCTINMDAAKTVIAEFTIIKPVTSNNEPEYQSGAANPAAIPQGGTITFTTQWQDSDGDYIVDVRVQYRKIGASQWTEEALDYIDGNTPPEFSKAVQVQGDLGQYEYQFRASDVAELNTPALHTTAWQGGGQFDIAADAGIDKAYFISETYPDYANVSGGGAFSKEWTIKNTGTSTWNSGYKLRYVSGGLSTSHNDVAVNGVVAPEETYTFSVPMQAPQQQAGTISYREDWQLVSPDGDVIKVYKSSTVWALITVKGSVTASNPMANTAQYTKVAQNGIAYQGSTLSSPGQPVISGSGGKSNSCNKEMTGDPVNTATGAQILDYNLLSVRGVLPVSFALSYNSLLLADDVAGKGWGLNDMGARLQEQANSGDVEIYWSRNRFNTFIKQADGSFESIQRGCRFDMLVKNADDSFTLERQNHTAYEFDSAGTLTRIRNQRGQGLEFTYDTDRLAKVVEPVSGVFLTYAYNTNDLLETVSDSLSREVKLAYDAEKRLTAITDAADQTTVFAYNEYGQILTAVNADGEQLFANTYDEEGRIATQDDGLSTNQVLKFDYAVFADGTGMTTVTNRNGGKRVYTFNDRYQLLTLRDELEDTVAVYTYNSDGKRTGVTDANGNATQMDYTDGNLTRITDAKGNAAQLTYDGSDNLTGIENALGHQTQIAYNTDNQVISHTDAEGNATAFAYTDAGQVQTIIHPSGATIAYEYENGLPVKTIDAEGNATTLAYDAAGRLESIASGGNASTLVYDAVNRLSAITDALDRTVGITYNSRGQLLTFTDAKGNVTTRQYDANGNLIALIDALGNTTRYEYDGEDRLAKIIDAKDHITLLGYDAAGQLASLTDALGNTRQLSYDAAGNLLERVDALGNVAANFNYDALNNVTAITDALGNTAKFDYDAVNNLIQTVDPLERITRFEHDPLNRLQAGIDAIGGQSSQDFDADGNRKEIQDPNSNQTQFKVNQNGRITELSVATGDTVKYRFNARNLLEQVTNARAQERSFVYDTAGRLSGWTDTDGEVIITYDDNDNVLSISSVQGTASYEYDALDRVKKYSDVLGNTLGYTYDAAGNLATLAYPDGKQVSYEYDATDRLVKVTDWANRETGYEYDANGRLQQTAYANGTVETRGYDVAGQLTQKTITDAAGALVVQYDYVYDATGNIIEEKLTPAAVESMIETALENMSPMNSSYGPANRLAAYGDEAVSFDADGNMINGPLNGELTDFSFDSRNRLTGVGVMGYRYDAQNRRIGVSVSGAETVYAINPVPALSQVLVRTKPDGTQTYYVYGLGLIGEETGGAYQVYHYDLRGSTVALSDAQGAVTDQFAYSPYGGLLSHSPATVDTPFLYNGRDGVMTDDTGLYYMRARYYDPEIRRFVNQDILLGFVADGQSLNRYAYVTGEPVRYVDPFGLLQKNLDGSFKTYEDTAGICKKPREFIDYLGNPIYDGKIIPVTLYANDGTPIDAYKFIEGYQGFKTDCHGVTFTEGEYWIDNPQVDKILTGDSYVKTNNPRLGDILIYRDSSSQIVHSVTVTSVDTNGNVTGVSGLSGLKINIRETTPANGFSSYDSLEYYTQVGICSI